MTSPAAIKTSDSMEIPASIPLDAVEKRHFIKDIDYLISSVDLQRIEKLSFMISDIPFYVTHKKDANNGETNVCIQAVLGYLPFSIEDIDKRQAIRMVLDSTHSLLHVRFGLDHHGRIFAAGNFASDALGSPHFVFYPLTIFLQEAQPFIDLIGQNL